jgi:hypothetical protein
MRVERRPFLGTSDAPRCVLPPSLQLIGTLCCLCMAALVVTRGVPGEAELTPPRRVRCTCSHIESYQHRPPETGRNAPPPESTTAGPRPPRNTEQTSYPFPPKLYSDSCPHHAICMLKHTYKGVTAQRNWLHRYWSFQPSAEQMATARQQRCLRDHVQHTALASRQQLVHHPTPRPRCKTSRLYYTHCEPDSQTVR